MPSPASELPTLRLHIRNLGDARFGVEHEDVTNGGRESDAFTFADDMDVWNSTARLYPDRASAELARLIFTTPIADFFDDRRGKAPNAAYVLSYVSTTARTAKPIHSTACNGNYSMVAWPTESPSRWPPTTPRPSPAMMP